MSNAETIAAFIAANAIEPKYDLIVEAAALVERLEMGACDVTEMGERRYARAIARANARLQRREFAELGGVDYSKPVEETRGGSAEPVSLLPHVECPYCPSWEKIAHDALTQVQGVRLQLAAAHDALGALLGPQGNTMEVKAAARAVLTKGAK